MRINTGGLVAKSFVAILLIVLVVTVYMVTMRVALECCSNQTYAKVVKIERKYYGNNEIPFAIDKKVKIRYEVDGEIYVKTLDLYNPASLDGINDDMVLIDYLPWNKSKCKIAIQPKKNQ